MDINYEKIPESIKLMIEHAVSSDPYGLSPETLFKNIKSTLQTTDVFKTSEIFNVSISLVEMIEKLN